MFMGDAAAQHNDSSRENQPGFREVRPFMRDSRLPNLFTFPSVPGLLM